MSSFVSAATVLASLAFSVVSVSAFDAAASDNLAVYWGAGNSQKPLGYFCNDDTIDIIPIGFVNAFPDEAGGNGYPGTDFGNACGGFYTTSGGQTTQLLASCPGIEADIKTCQANGKKVLLSLGGASAAGAYVASETSAVDFADFLWGAFGPQTDDWTAAGNPRPFGDAVVDGFDFDIESLVADVPTAIDFGYAAMANEFRRLFALCTSSQTFYLSAAPQCNVPDGHLADAISKAVFDFIFVQFYNTPQCSARAHFDSTYGQAANGGVPSDISYDMWITWVLGLSANKATKVYIGLPAAPEAAGDNGAFYLSPTEAGQLITDFKCKYPANFGGVMLWEATYSDNNQISGQSYAQAIKPLLTGCSCLGSTTSSSVTSSTTSSTTSSVYTTLSTPTTSTTSTTTSSYSYSSGSSVSTPAGPVSSSTISSTITSSSLTSSFSSSTCVWGSACSTSSSVTSSSSFSTPTGWSTFGTCTSSTCKGLATGPGLASTSANPTATGSSSSTSSTSFTGWGSWSADPSSTSSVTLTSTWTITGWGSRPTDPSASTSTTSVTTVVTMTIVPVPSSVWYTSTFSHPSPIVISSLSLASTAFPAPLPSSSSSSTVKSANGSSWPPASVVSAAPTSVPTTSKPSSTTPPVLPAITMTTVSVAQGATWSSDPSLTFSPNAVHVTNAAPVATFTGAASRQQVVGKGAKGMWAVMGALGFVGALVL